MNLNNIVSLKKRGKLIKEIIGNLKNNQKFLENQVNKHSKQKQQTIGHQYTTFSSNNFEPHFDQAQKLRKISFKSVENDHGQEELISMLKQKFSDDFGSKINKLVVNNKFKTQNLNMNININYNPAQSTRKKSYKKQKQLSMYLKKNKTNTSKQLYQNNKYYNLNESQQKDFQNKYKNIDFKGTFGLQNQFYTINEQHQNYLIKDTKRKILRKQQSVQQRQKLKSYKQIYSMKLSNDRNLKGFRNKQSKSLNLRANNSNLKQSIEKFHSLRYENNQFINYSNKINLFVPQKKQIKSSLRYKSLEQKHIKNRYESTEPAQFFNTKSSTIQLRNSQKYYQKGMTEYVIKNKDSQIILNKDSFRRQFSKRRVLTQESKQMRKRIYNSINKKDESLQSSYQKLKLFKQPKQKSDRMKVQQKDSQIFSYLKKTCIQKVQNYLALKSTSKKNKTIHVKQTETFSKYVDQQQLKKKQFFNETAVQNQLINLLETQDKSQQNLTQIIQIAFQILKSQEIATQSLYYGRKFITTVCLFYIFKVIIGNIFSTSEKELKNNLTQLNLKIKVKDIYSKQVIQDCNINSKHFNQLLKNIENTQNQENHANTLINDLITILKQQIQSSHKVLKIFCSNSQNTCFDQVILQRKIQMTKIVQENCTQTIIFFERIHEKYRKLSQNKKGKNFLIKIVQSIIFELKLIELVNCQKLLMIKKSRLLPQHWDCFHLDTQNLKQFQFFIKKFEDLQIFISRQIEKNRTEGKSFTVNLVSEIEELFSKTSNLDSQNLDFIILGTLKFRDIYLNYYPGQQNEQTKSNKMSLNEIYFNLKNSFLSGQYVLLKAYTLFQKQEYHQCQMYIQQSINQCDKPYLQKLLCLDLMIKIKTKSFYDAESQIQRLPYYGIFLNHQNYEGQLLIQSNVYELKCFQRFISGVMLLIKRKIQEGLSCLQETYQLIHMSPRKQSDSDIMPSFIIFIKSIIEGYFGYSYYCLRNLDEAMKSFQKQIFILSFSQNNQSNSSLNIVSYNYLLCMGLKELKQKNFKQAIDLFKRSLIKFNRPQPHVYLTIAYLRLINLGNHEPQSRQLSFDSQQNQNYEQNFYVNLNIACKLVSGMSNNFASQIFYLRSLYDCSKGDWQLALIDIDESIEKSEENYPKQFYLRALILACGQNYSQAINQASIVISIDQKYHQAYLLRSKCSQLQGNQNQAFIDLQTYIGLRPQDTQIHKYAGHLLFENGAFEDAILAYQQGQSKNLDNSRIEESDFHVYLTKSKTYFLLGEFDQAAEEMKIASKIKNDQPQYWFDYKMIQYLSNLFKMFENYQIKCEVDLENKEKIEQNQEKLLKQLSQKLQQIQDIYKTPNKDTQSQFIQGKIFKTVEYHLFRFAILFYLRKYNESVEQIKKCIEAKQVSFQLQNSDKLNQEFQQEENQKQLFITQMHYNLSLVYLKLQSYEQAEQELLKCQTSRTSKGYLQWKHLLSHIGNKQAFCKQIQCKQITEINVFSDKNKLSKYFPYSNFYFKRHSSKHEVEKRMKPCIPYPKVQPPEISPSFDLNLLTSFSQDDIEKKPQAPWITNEKNCIKFTQEMKIFSRLDIDDSQNGSRLKKAFNSKQKNQLSQASNFESQFLNENLDEKILIKKRSSKLSQNFREKAITKKNSESFVQSKKKNLYELLKLDPDVEMKLKKLVH